MMRVISGTIAAVALAVGVVGANADTISRETLTHKFLDYCVITQSRVEGIDRIPMVDKCHKAAASAMTGFEGERFDSPSSSKFTAEQDKAIRAAIAAAFAKK